jgi:hypothetical protein
MQVFVVGRHLLQYAASTPMISADTIVTGELFQDTSALLITNSIGKAFDILSGVAESTHITLMSDYRIMAKVNAPAAANLPHRFTSFLFSPRISPMNIR